MVQLDVNNLKDIINTLLPADITCYCVAIQFEHSKLFPGPEITFTLEKRFSLCLVRDNFDSKPIFEANIPTCLLDRVSGYSSFHSADSYEAIVRYFVEIPLHECDALLRELKDETYNKYSREFDEQLECVLEKKVE